VKATDELCTRTFFMHTLKSPRQKCQKFPDGGKTLPDRGALAPRKPPPWRRPWTLDITWSVCMSVVYDYRFGLFKSGFGEYE